MMDKYLKQVVWFFMMLIFPLVLDAQKEVIQFLDIPIDGYKPEMFEKLKARGYTAIPANEDMLIGEFNGTDVLIYVQTVNNKVWRIGIMDEYPTNETNIKIRFNNLVEQFANNNRYTVFLDKDSIIAENIISEDEDITYEMLVNKKRFEAQFYQMTPKFESLKSKYDLLMAKDRRNEQESLELIETMKELQDGLLASANNRVWFMINGEFSEYRILMFYENLYNAADGSRL